MYSVVGLASIHLHAMQGPRRERSQGDGDNGKLVEFVNIFHGEMR